MPHLPGRPSKGERDAIMAKPPVEFGAILKRNADVLGLSYGEYMVALAAKALDMPQFAPTQVRRGDVQLDVPEEANTRAA